MCIVVTNENPESTGVGYKLFEHRGRFLAGSNNIDDRKTRPTKKWLEERDYRFGTSYLKYACGWHIFKNLEDAIEKQTNFNDRWGVQVIRKVRYRGAFVSGPQDDTGAYVVVANEILIIPGKVT